jgi:MoaA/NifB/PqqE/SkfB family radical SAM enzyme
MNFQQVGSREGVVVDLEVTSLCNAACEFCPRAYLNRKAKFINVDTVRRLAACLQKEAKAATVVLCGIGEPSLHPELETLISILAEAGANIGMTTNGWNLTAARVDKLVKAGLSELNVSLNAAASETHARRMQLGNFDQIYNACKEVAAERKSRWPSLKFHVSFVVTEGSEDEAQDFVNEWRKSGVSRIWLHPMTNRAGLLGPECPPGDVARLAQTLSDESRVKVDLFARHDGASNLCHIAGGIDFISVDGEMLLCAQDYKAMYSFGNIAHEELARLHEHKLLIHLRGETAGTCVRCTFCPQSFRWGQDQSYTIVQAGAF